MYKVHLYFGCVCLTHSWEVSWVHIGFLILTVAAYLSWWWLFICIAWLRRCMSFCMIQLFYIYWMYLKVSMMSILHSHNVNVRAFEIRWIWWKLPKKLKVEVLPDEFHCTKNKKIKYGRLFAFIQTKAGLIICLFRSWLLYSSLQWASCCIWSCNLDAAKEFTGWCVRPTPSFTSESSLWQQGHKQMGYHCPCGAFQLPLTTVPSPELVRETFFFYFCHF